MGAKINNSDEQRKIRRSQMTLVIVGTGIIMFGAWAALKMFSMILLRTSETIEETRKTLFYGQDGVSDKEVFIWIMVITALYVLIELSVRLYVGKHAIAEGRGLGSGRLYLVFTAMLILAGALAVLLDGYVVMINLVGGGIEEGELTRRNAGTSLVIDLTSLVMTIEMMAAAFRVRKYKKTIRETEADDAA